MRWMACCSNCHAPEAALVVYLGARYGEQPEQVHGHCQGHLLLVPEERWRRMRMRKWAPALAMKADGSAWAGCARQAGKAGSGSCLLPGRSRRAAAPGRRERQWDWTERSSQRCRRTGVYTPSAYASTSDNGPKAAGIRRKWQDSRSPIIVMACFRIIEL